MKKAILQYVAVVLVSCLIADPITASSFTQLTLPVMPKASIDSGIFQSEAMILSELSSPYLRQIEFRGRVKKSFAKMLNVVLGLGTTISPSNKPSRNGRRGLLVTPAL